MLEKENIEKQNIESIKELQFQITNLKDLNRKLSYNLEKEEEDNAKLESELQMKRYKNIYKRKPKDLKNKDEDHESC